MPIAEDFHAANVASQSDNPTSLLTLYRRLFALRRERSTFTTGRLEIIAVQGPLLAYQRVGNEENYMILLNFSSTPQTFKWDQTWAPQVCFSSFLDKNQERFHAPFEVRGDEGLILKQQS